MADSSELQPQDRVSVLKQIGARIKARRESLGLSIEEVQEKTRIRLQYLRAIEEGDDSISAGKAYFRAFLKTYANYLGLDGTSLSREYWAMVEREEHQPTVPTQARRPSHRTSRRSEGKSDYGLNRRHAPDALEPEEVHEGYASVPAPGEEQKLRESRGKREYSMETRTAKSGHRRRRERKKGQLLILVVCLAAVVFGVWWGKDRLRVPEPAAPVQENVGQGGGGGASEPQPTPGEVPAKTETVVTRSDPDPGTTIFEVNKGPLDLTVSISSEASCWVRVECDGKVIAEKTLPSGAKEEYKAVKEIKVRSGRPWVMNLTLNGKDLGVAGPFGPVKDLIFRCKD